MSLDCCRWNDALKTNGQVNDRRPSGNPCPAAAARRCPNGCLISALHLRTRPGCRSSPDNCGKSSWKATRFPAFTGLTADPSTVRLGWSVGAETELPNHDGHWRILRFRPAEAGHEGMGTAALAVALREGVPTALGQQMPFLWNVAPTSESWGCGYAVNGPFKLDPGRTHVSLDDDATLRAVGGLGDALGKGLIRLHDALVCPTDGVRGLLGNGDSRSFLTSLWEILAPDLENQDPLRRRFLLQLHGDGRGISAWMAARSAVPTGLPAPFTQVLPPLTSATRIEVAADGLDNADFCHALAEIETTKTLGAWLRHAASSRRQPNVCSNLCAKMAVASSRCRFARATCCGNWPDSGTTA